MIVGGRTVSQGSGTSLVELYDIEKGFVAKLPSMPTARYSFPFQFDYKILKYFKNFHHILFYVNL